MFVLILYKEMLRNYILNVPLNVICDQVKELNPINFVKFIIFL